MDPEPVSHLVSEANRLVRLAYEAGLREGRTIANDERAAIHEAGLREGRASAGSAGTGRKTKQRKKDWGTVRPAVYEAISAPPGRTPQEIAVVTGGVPVTIRNALADFVAEGIAVKDGQGRYVAVDPERNLGAASPKPRQLKDAILAVVARKPGATTLDVVAEVGRKSTSVRATLYAMRDDGEVSGSSSGWTVQAGQPDGSGGTATTSR